MDDRDPRDKNNEAAFAAVTAWAKLNGYLSIKPAILDRLALGLVTESSGGFIFANDGTAYPALSAVRAVLRRSLNLPHDKVGHDGRSTGPLQQICYEANDVMIPPQKWGWSSMAATMNPATSALMFVAALRVTTNSVYVTPAGYSVECGDPIVADVLRVQQPTVGATLPNNYRLEQVTLAKLMARGGPRFWTDRGTT